MHKVGRLYCEGCQAETMFIAYEPPYDENEAACEGCGFSFGYLVDPGAVLNDEGVVVQTAMTRPVLDPKVLRAAMAAYQGEVAAELNARYGGQAYATEVQRMRRGLESEDRAERQQLLGARLPPKRG